MKTSPFMMVGTKRPHLSDEQDTQLRRDLEACWRIVHNAEMSPEYLAHFCEAYDRLVAAGAENPDYEIQTIFRSFDERYANELARLAVSSHSG